MNETAVQRQCLDYLRLVGVFAWRQNNIGNPGRRFNGLRGVADILGILPDGRFLAIEVKVPGGKLRPEQEEFRDNVIKRGGEYFCICDVQTLVNMLREIGIA